MRRLLAVWLAGVLGVASQAAAQECLHGPGERPEQRVRREQAFQVAVQINLAQVVVIGPGPLNRKFRPLNELGNIPPTPPGFELRFHTDGATYAFSLKDTLDPCHYAIFSDDDKRVYEATPTERMVTVPARTK